MIVMPGLVETHFHMWSSLGRNFVADDYRVLPGEVGDRRALRARRLLRERRARPRRGAQRRDHDRPQLVPQHPDAAARRRGARARTAMSRSVRGTRTAIATGCPSTSRSTSPTSTGCRRVVRGRSSFDGRVHLGVNLRGPDLGAAWRSFDHEMGEARRRRLPVAIHTVQGGVDRRRRHGTRAQGLPRAGLPHRPLPRRDRGGPCGAGPDRHAAQLRRPLRAAPRATQATLAPRCSDSWPRASTSRSRSTPPRSRRSTCSQAMNVAWNLGIPWEGSRDCIAAGPHLPALPRDRDDRTARGRSGLGTSPDR